MDFAKLDFQQLRVKHISFKSKVRLVLFGGSYDPGLFSDRNPVTEWFTGVGSKKYAREHEVRQLQALHDQILHLAQRLIRMYQQNAIDQAHTGLAELNELSDAFLLLLDSFQERFITQQPAY